MMIRGREWSVVRIRKEAADPGRLDCAGSTQKDGKFALSSLFIECCIYQESMTNIFVPTFGKSF